MSRSGSFFSEFDKNGNYLLSDFHLAFNNGMATDSIGNIYICGTYNIDSLTFDNITLSKSQNNFAQSLIVRLNNAITKIPSWVEKGMGVEIYPNPCQGTFNLILPQGETTEIALRIIDSHGRVCYEHLIKAMEGAAYYQVNLSWLPKGIYFVNVTSNLHAKAIRLVIE